MAMSVSAISKAPCLNTNFYTRTVILAFNDIHICRYCLYYYAFYDCSSTFHFPTTCLSLGFSLAHIRLYYQQAGLYKLLT
jgi:hypothetical protein